MLLWNFKFTSKEEKSSGPKDWELEWQDFSEQYQKPKDNGMPSKF